MTDRVQRKIRGWPFMAGLLVMALVGSVGCLPKSHQPGAQPLALWLEIPAEVRAGETVPLKLKVKNISDRPVALSHGRPAHDFLITKPDGTGVWRWAPVFLDILLVTTLNPGEEAEFAGEWKQQDIYGNTVPSGTYLVQGILMTSEPVREPKTKPKRLVIKP